ncbi:MAG: thiamine pyrophosphate-binding protein [Elusimicrobia bacterium]|nr:thiamine pyrophosphate-binding protein [Elusimicrobiota bacterium]
MKIRGSDIVVRALEEEGVRFTFGIPGTHNIELYDSLERSKKITPILVTDEQCASFMADAVSRTSDSIGVVNVVPGAGVTHCLSGVAEAYMDNVPLLVLTCGIRIDTGKAYQLHDVDQLAVLMPITKAILKPTRADEIYPSIRRAFAIARSGTPGPVAVEIPANFYLLTQQVPGLRYNEPKPGVPKPKPEDSETATQILRQAQCPLLYIGNGARGASSLIQELAEKISVPVATTIQGKGIFPESHPLWLWNGLGASAPPFVRNIMKQSDCMVAIGCRFGEVATASYGFAAPKNLIHVDINREVFNRNYPARLAIESDAVAFLKALIPHLDFRKNEALRKEISREHEKIQRQWLKKTNRRKVAPAAFFESLQKIAGPKAIYATDSGNGTFLAMEHLRLQGPGCFIGPIDYSCMGYSVPAAIGAKFANPDRNVVALAGDGALLMTGLELLTAAAYKMAPVICVLRDGELGQIVQLQRTSFNRDTCSVLHPYSVESFARATHCEYLPLELNAELNSVLKKAFEIAATKKPVMVEVAIDYSRKSFFTKGVIATNFWRLPFGERLRMLTRAVGRRIKRQVVG